MTMTLSGSGTIAGLVAGGLPDASVTAPDLASGAARTNFGAGTVLQVVQGSTSTQSSTSSSTYSASNLTASITPSSATSKVLVIYSMVVYCDTTNGEPHTTLARNGSLLNASGGFGDAFNSAGRLITTQAASFLDSPASTSSTTYTVYFKIDTAGVAYAPASGTQATITLMEIAA